MTRQEIENKIDSIINSIWVEYGYHKCKPEEVLLEYSYFNVSIVREIIRNIDKCFNTNLCSKFGYIESCTFGELCDIVEKEL